MEGVDEYIAEQAFLTERELDLVESERPETRRGAESLLVLDPAAVSSSSSGGEDDAPGADKAGPSVRDSAGLREDAGDEADPVDAIGEMDINSPAGHNDAITVDGDVDGELKQPMYCSDDVVRAFLDLPVEKRRSFLRDNRYNEAIQTHLEASSVAFASFSGHGSTWKPTILVDAGVLVDDAEDLTLGEDSGYSLSPRSRGRRLLKGNYRSGSPLRRAPFSPQQPPTNSVLSDGGLASPTGRKQLSLVTSLRRKKETRQQLSGEVRRSRSDVMIAQHLNVPGPIASLSAEDEVVAIPPEAKAVDSTSPTPEKGNNLSGRPTGTGVEPQNIIKHRKNTRRSRSSALTVETEPERESTTRSLSAIKATNTKEMKALAIPSTRKDPPTPTQKQSRIFPRKNTSELLDLHLVRDIDSSAAASRQRESDHEHEEIMMQADFVQQWSVQVQRLSLTKKAADADLEHATAIVRSSMNAAKEDLFLKLPDADEADPVIGKDAEVENAPAGATGEADSATAGDRDPDKDNENNVAGSNEIENERSDDRSPILNAHKETATRTESNAARGHSVPKYQRRSTKEDTSWIKTSSPEVLAVAAAEPGPEGASFLSHSKSLRPPRASGAEKQEDDAGLIAASAPTEQDFVATLRSKLGSSHALDAAHVPQKRIQRRGQSGDFEPPSRSAKAVLRGMLPRRKSRTDSGGMEVDDGLTTLSNGGEAAAAARRTNCTPGRDEIMQMVSSYVASIRSSNDNQNQNVDNVDGSESVAKPDTTLTHTNTIAVPKQHGPNGKEYLWSLDEPAKQSPEVVAGTMTSQVACAPEPRPKPNAPVLWPILLRDDDIRGARHGIAQYQTRKQQEESQESARKFLQRAVVKPSRVSRGRSSATKPESAAGGHDQQKHGASPIIASLESSLQTHQQQNAHSALRLLYGHRPSVLALQKESWRRSQQHENDLYNAPAVKHQRQRRESVSPSIQKLHRDAVAALARIVSLEDHYYRPTEPEDSQRGHDNRESPGRARHSASVKDLSGHDYIQSTVGVRSADARFAAHEDCASRRDQDLHHDPSSWQGGVDSQKSSLTKEHHKPSVTRVLRIGSGATKSTSRFFTSTTTTNGGGSTSTARQTERVDIAQPRARTGAAVDSDALLRNHLASHYEGTEKKKANVMPGPTRTTSASTTGPEHHLKSEIRERRKRNDALVSSILSSRDHAARSSAGTGRDLLPTSSASDMIMLKRASRNHEAHVNDVRLMVSASERKFASDNSAFVRSFGRSECLRYRGPIAAPQSDRSSSALYLQTARPLAASAGQRHKHNHDHMHSRSILHGHFRDALSGVSVRSARTSSLVLSGDLPSMKERVDAFNAESATPTTFFRNAAGRQPSVRSSGRSSRSTSGSPPGQSVPRSELVLASPSTSRRSISARPSTWHREDFVPSSSSWRWIKSRNLELPTLKDLKSVQDIHARRLGVSHAGGGVHVGLSDDEEGSVSSFSEPLDMLFDDDVAVGEQKKRKTLKRVGTEVGGRAREKRKGRIADGEGSVLEIEVEERATTSQPRKRSAPPATGKAKAKAVTKAGVKGNATAAGARSRTTPPAVTTTGAQAKTKAGDGKNKAAAVTSATLPGAVQRGRSAGPASTAAAAKKPVAVVSPARAKPAATSVSGAAVNGVAQAKSKLAGLASTSASSSTSSSSRVAAKPKPTSVSKSAAPGAVAPKKETTGPPPPKTTPKVTAPAVAKPKTNTKAKPFSKAATVTSAALKALQAHAHHEEKLPLADGENKAAPLSIAHTQKLLKQNTDERSDGTATGLPAKRTSTLSVVASPSIVVAPAEPAPAAVPPLAVAVVQEVMSPPSDEKRPEARATQRLARLERQAQLAPKSQSRIKNAPAPPASSSVGLTADSLNSVPEILAQFGRLYAAEEQLPQIRMDHAPPAAPLPQIGRDTAPTTSVPPRSQERLLRAHSIFDGAVLLIDQLEESLVNVPPYLTEPPRSPSRSRGRSPSPRLRTYDGEYTIPNATSSDDGHQLLRGNFTTTAAPAGADAHAGTTTTSLSLRKMDSTRSAIANLDEEFTPGGVPPSSAQHQAAFESHHAQEQLTERSTLRRVGTSEGALLVLSESASPESASAEAFEIGPKQCFFPAGISGTSSSGSSLRSHHHHDVSAETSASARALPVRSHHYHLQKQKHTAIGEGEAAFASMEDKEEGAMTVENSESDVGGIANFVLETTLAAFRGYEPSPSRSSPGSNDTVVLQEDEEQVEDLGLALRNTSDPEQGEVELATATGVGEAIGAASPPGPAVGEKEVDVEVKVVDAHGEKEAATLEDVSRPDDDAETESESEASTRACKIKQQRQASPAGNAESKQQFSPEKITTRNDHNVAALPGGVENLIGEQGEVEDIDDDEEEMEIPYESELDGTSGAPSVVEQTPARSSRAPHEEVEEEELYGGHTTSTSTAFTPTEWRQADTGTLSRLENDWSLLGLPRSTAARGSAIRMPGGRMSASSAMAGRVRPAVSAYVRAPVAERVDDISSSEQGRFD